MIKNRTTQLVFLTMACTTGLFGTLASLGLFTYEFRWDFYVHFTNLSNYFCLAVLFWELVQTIRRKDDGFVSACPLLKFIGLLAILLTFVVFNVLLAPDRAPKTNFTVNSIVFHVLMPIFYIADWFLFYERKQVKWTYPLCSIGLPLAYVIGVFIQAAALGFDSSIKGSNGKSTLIYPYFFLNVETQGWAGVGKWIVVLLVAFVAVGFAFYGVDKLLGGKKKAQKV